MRIEETNIPGLKLIHLNKFQDNRGSFIKVFNEKFYSEHNLEYEFKENYFSVSQKDVIRGMHFQIPPMDHTKLVYLNQGKILDVVLDIRKDSQAYGKYFSTILDTDNPVVIYIPKGCAHGFLSMEDHSMVTYLQTSCYDAACDKGIRYDSFGFDWGIENPVISERDKGFPAFEQFINPFL